MNMADLKQKLEEIIDTLPENKIEAILDFATYLRERGQAEEFLKMQMDSKAYHDWLSPENDIYDEVFKDELKSR